VAARRGMGNKYLLTKRRSSISREWVDEDGNGLDLKEKEEEYGNKREEGDLSRKEERKKHT
jgi:hypothetical protein